MHHSFSRLRQAWAGHYAKCLAVLIFSIPVIYGVFSRDVASDEKRKLVAFPPMPRTSSEALTYPGRIDQWINDHMGLRSKLIALNNKIRFTLFQEFPTSQVMQGQNGRTFLVAHRADNRDYNAVQVPCGYTPRNGAILRNELNQLAAELERRGMAANILLVPSAPIIYTEELPHFLRQRCERQSTPLPKILQDPALSEVARARTEYPLQELLAAKAKYKIYPDNWFHWGGQGTRLSAELTMRRFGPANNAPPLVSSLQSQPSDISNLFPGVQLHSMVETIDFAASGVTECREAAACFSEVPDVLSKMWATARYQNPRAPLGQLVIIADSFGLGFAPWMARYYREVVLVPTQDIPTLNPEQLERLRQFLFANTAQRQYLFVYHDTTLHDSRIWSDGRYLFPQVFADAK